VRPAGGRSEKHSQSQDQKPERAAIAIYHATTKPLSRSTGRSSVAAAAYRAGVKLEDLRTGQVFDFTRRSGVVVASIVTPDGAGAFARDRASLWNAAEAAEKRKDSRTAREWILALPFELEAEQRSDLAIDFARELVKRYGVVADVAIHAPLRGGDDRNHHVHILCTTRKVDGETFGEKCELELSDAKRKTEGLCPAADEISALRERWAELANAALERSGSAARVDHRSLVAQQDATFERGDLVEALALDRPAQIHVGVYATQLDRRSGQAVSRRGRMRERVVAMMRHAATSAARWAHELIEVMRTEAEMLVAQQDVTNEMLASATSRPTDGVEKQQKREEENPLVDLVNKWRTKAKEARPKPDGSTHERKKTKMFRENEDATPNLPRPARPLQHDRDGGPDVGSKL
jgi:hypothetical protein